MHYRTPPHLSWCLTAGQVVFLDIRRDRYFQLAANVVDVFRQALAGETPVEGLAREALANLIAQGLLVAVDDCAMSLMAPPPTRATASLLEAPVRTSSQPALGTALCGIGAVFATRAKLRRLTFEQVISEVAGRRRTYGGGFEPPSERTATLALAFARCRLLVPIRPVCLLDSLALLDVLHGQGLQADLVFGVALHPFRAHCWVQSGELILNDGLDRVLAHTPIRVV